MNGQRRAGCAVLAVLGGTTLVLRATDALPGWIASVPRGVHICSSLSEAESRTGLALQVLGRALPDYRPAANGIRTVAKPIASVAIDLRGGPGLDSQLTFFRSRAGGISTLLRPNLPVFHQMEIAIVPGRIASLRSVTLGDGSVCQDLEWPESDGRAALHSKGRTVELLRVARQIVEGGS